MIKEIFSNNFIDREICLFIIKVKNPFIIKVGETRRANYNELSNIGQ